MANCGCGTAIVEGARFCLQCGAPVVSASQTDPFIGRTIGSYRILAPLGEGAMGKVYRAEQISLGRPVCIKTLLPHFASDPAVVARFKREAKAASALSHPNIVGILDFGQSDSGVLYIAMELVEGRNLRAVIQNDSPLSLHRTFSTMEQLLSALEEAHGMGVIHRDLKPENVLVGTLRDGSDLVKVVDFGIAKVMNEDLGDARLTGTGMVCGTPGYMAPEQIAGDELDARADIYASGVILFELLTGKPPFSGASMQDLLHLHLTQVPPAPSQLAPFALPPELDLLVLRALERKREKRFRSALELKRSLELLRTALRHGSPASPLPEISAASVSAQTSTSSSEHLSRIVSKRLLEYTEDLSTLLAGEKRNATVLFADISGFTAMSETMDPEDVRNLMNRCFDGMVEAVLRYDGHVDKFIGDCIMVVFGAPKSHEDDPERAVRCALDIRSYLNEVNKTLSKPLGVRIGINAGEVMAGGVGGKDKEKQDYTVMGDVVNTAQRIESAAEVGQIWVSRMVKQLTSSVVRYRELSPIQVKGKKEPLSVFAVEGLASTTVDPSEPIVGRARELEACSKLVTQARAGRSGGVVFLGEAGMGKTRLLQEAATMARSAGMQVALGRAGRFSEPEHLELLREAIFSLCGGVPKELSEANSQLATLSRFGLDGNDLQRLQHLFGTGSEIPGLDREDAKRLDQATLLNLFVGASKQSGLALILDDLHGADAASLEFLDALIGQAKKANLALIAAARPGNTDKILPRVSSLELRPLSQRDILEIASHQLSGAPLIESVQDAIVQRAEGSPLITREIVRNLIDCGAIHLSGGSWQALPTFNGSELPDSVQLLVGAKFDSLSSPAKQLLRCGAVIGRIFPLELVAAAVDTPVDIQVAISECVNRGFLIPFQQPPGAFQFAQAIFHEVVLRGITKSDLKHRNLRIAEALERGVSFGAEHPAEAMARHFLAAEQNRKAIKYLIAAADRLVERKAFVQATEHYRRALTLSMSEGTRAGLSETLAAHLLSLGAKAAEAQNLIGPDQTPSILDPLLEYVPANRGVATRAEVLRQKAAALLKLSRVDAAQEILTQAIKSVSGQEHAELLANLNADLAAVWEAKGDLSLATKYLADGFKLLGAIATRERDLVWRYLNQLGRIHLRTRQTERAIEFFENARMQAKRVASLIGEAKAVSNLAGAIAMKGNIAGASSLFADALELATRAGDRIGVARTQYNLGKLLMSMGQREEATARLSTAFELSQELGWREGVAAASQALDAVRAQAKPIGSAPR